MLSENTDLQLVDIKTVNVDNEIVREYTGIDYNYFVETGGLFKERKPLLFRFKSSTDFLWAYEEMFFVLSELQLHFYEYRCIGEII